MFGAFIFACGTTHLLGIWTLWVPTYRLEGLVKLLTGCVSIATAIALVPLMPRALALPSLQAANERFRLVTDSLPALIAYVDADRRYRFNN